MPFQTSVFHQTFNHNTWRKKKTLCEREKKKDNFKQWLSENFTPEKVLERKFQPEDVHFIQEVKKRNRQF